MDYCKEWGPLLPQGAQFRNDCTRQPTEDGVFAEERSSARALAAHAVPESDPTELIAAK
ncbi:MAG: hypothetical protein KJ747_09625 [Actinobacteria bacterium]|nr:hypothetical protein [Actinomycetota bacterium]